MPSIEITVDHPDNPLNIPSYEGPDTGAVDKLIPGVYTARDEQDIEGDLVVHQDGWSAFTYRACAMMGCEWSGWPHNHTELAPI